MRPPLGIDTLKGAVRIDVGLTFLLRERKRKKERKGGDVERGALI